MTEEYDFTATWTIDTWRKVAKANEDAAAANLLAAVRLQEALEQSLVRLDAIQTDLKRRTAGFNVTNAVRMERAMTRAVLAWQYKRNGVSDAKAATRLDYADGSAVRRLRRKYPES
jgi:hypothetical protein